MYELKGFCCSEILRQQSYFDTTEYAIFKPFFKFGACREEFYRKLKNWAGNILNRRFSDYQLFKSFNQGTHIFGVAHGHKVVHVW